jgi:RNA polymerase sigma factor (sigma-70 family)
LLCKKYFTLPVTFEAFQTIYNQMTAEDYQECVNLYADFLYRFILKHCKHQEDARDVVQNAFEILWNKKKEVEMKKSKSFLFKVAYWNMVDLHRKNNKTTLVEEIPAHAAIATVKKQGLKEALDKALQTLPSIQKSVVLLRDYEGYHYKEIGEVLNLTESQVKVYLYRARLALKNYLVSIEQVL